MNQHIFLVFSNPVKGREEEYNEWYTQTHLPDVLKVSGFVAAQRFELGQVSSDLPGKYLAIYEIESTNPEQTLNDLMSRVGTDDLVMTESMDMKCVSATLFSALTQRLLNK